MFVILFHYFRLGYENKKLPLYNLLHVGSLSYQISVFSSAVHNGIDYNRFVFLIHFIEYKMLLHYKDSVSLFFED